MKDKVKETIREWARKIREEAHRENTEGKDEIGLEAYNYNMGQIDMADSILAQLDRWFDEK